MVGHKRVLLASPRGYCAGVDRAVIAVEKALERYGAPVYVRKQIVHNIHVVTELETKGAIFVDEVDEVPSGAHVVFSAHGVAPAVVSAAAGRGLHAIDATCPLVSKVHKQAMRHQRLGQHLLHVVDVLVRQVARRFRAPLDDRLEQRLMLLAQAVAGLAALQVHATDVGHHVVLEQVEQPHGSSKRLGSG